MNTKLHFLLVLPLLVILVGASAGVVAAQSEVIITIGPDALGAEYETRYTQQISASGGAEPYTFSLASGTLPYGITLSSSGLLSGFPVGPDATPGNYSITIQVQDANLVTASRGYTFIMDKGTPSVAPGSPSTIYWHHPFNLSANVLNDLGNGSYGALTGTVAFSIDGSSVPGCEAVTLDGGFAICPWVSMDLSIGAHTFETVYTPAGGDEVYSYPAAGSGTLTIQPGSYSIQGALFQDNNQNGVYDSGEYTLYKNWTINLDQGCDGTADYSTIASQGLYTFSGIPGGQCYRITEVIGEPGWQQTSFPADFWLSSDPPMINIANYYPAIAVSPIDLPYGNMGQEYQQALSANGGTEPYTFTIQSGALPAGLTLSADGILSGTPTVAGGFNFGVQAEDATHAAGSRSYNLNIRTDGLFSFTSSSNPSAQGDLVTFTVSATGDLVIPTLVDPIPPVGQVTFYDDGMAIAGCSDLSLNYSADGIVISPAVCTTSALEIGPHQITATYTDMSGLVNPPALALTQVVEQPSSYTISGDIFSDYNQNGVMDAGENNLYSSGPVYLDQGCDGVVDYTTWVNTGGYSFSGILGGECYRITIELEESGWQLSKPLADFPLSGNTTLDIGFYYPTITFSPSPSELPSGNVGVEYSQRFTASGGAEPYYYMIVNSNLPDGLTLSVDAGGPILSGTPTVAGYYEFMLTVWDANGAQSAEGSGNYDLIVKTDGDFTITSSANPSAPGEEVIFTVSATGDAVLPGNRPIAPMGSVSFAADGAPIEGCSEVYLNMDQNGAPGNYPATCTTAVLETGSHEITASYTDYLEIYFGTGLYNPPSLVLVQVVGLSNTAPLANPGGPYMAAINTALPFDGSGSSDVDGDPLTYAWDFGDSSADAGATPAHTYTAAGVYNVCLTVKDGMDDSQKVCTLAAVYDPSAGFVTGGGWFDSPTGALVDYPNQTGKATFGFVSKYLKGQTVPTGNTEFQFQAGSFSFHSTAYDWLVVSKTGNTAQFKGSGTVNGEMAPGGSAYKFQVWAGDASPDTFRIKIWWEDASGEHLVYDNGFNQAIGGGSIIVHASK